MCVRARAHVRMHLCIHACPPDLTPLISLALGVPELVNIWSWEQKTNRILHWTFLFSCQNLTVYLFRSCFCWYSLKVHMRAPPDTSDLFLFGFWQLLIPLSIILSEVWMSIELHFSWTKCLVVSFFMVL